MSMSPVPFPKYLRNNSSRPQVLAVANPTAVSATTGLGTGGGASCQQPFPNGEWDVLVYPGAGATAAGSVALTFGTAPPTLFLSADEQFGTVTQALVSNVLTISWTAANFPSPSGSAVSKPYRLHLEWATSQ